MTLVLPNADNNLLSMLNTINKMRSQPYTYFHEDEFSEDLIASVREGEAEFEYHKAHGTLITYASAQEAFDSIV